MSPVSSGFVIFGTVTDDPNVLEYLARLAAHIHGEHTAKLARRLDVSSRYLRYMLDGQKDMTIQRAHAIECYIREVGDRQSHGLGNEWVRYVRAALDGEDVTRPVADFASELREANKEIHKTFALVEDVMEDGIVTADEKIAVTTHAANAKRELDDVVEAALNNRCKGVRK